MELHWLQIRFRIEFKILLITFKILRGLAPSYSSSPITLRRPRDTILKIPMIIFHSGTPPYGYLGNTVTSLLRPLFLAALQNDHTFSCKKTSLIRSPDNTANFFAPLVTVVLTGFHCSDIDDDNIMKLESLDNSQNSKYM